MPRSPTVPITRPSNSASSIPTKNFSYSQLLSRCSGRLLRRALCKNKNETSHASSARAAQSASELRLHRLRRKNSRKVLLVSGKKKNPKNRRHHSRLPACMAQQSMKQQNVDNHWPQQRQTQPNLPDHK